MIMSIVLSKLNTFLDVELAMKPLKMNLFSFRIPKNIQESFECEPERNHK